MRDPVVVAEIGCNHKGSEKIALEMIDTVAGFCHAKVAKFQKRNPRELLTAEEYNAPHPVLRNAYGPTYGEHREALEFDLDTHARLKAYCEEKGIDYACSVWDTTSAREIASLDPLYVKIPSAMNLCFDDLYPALFECYSGPVHVSLGMVTKTEEKSIIEFFAKHKKLDSLVLYHCTSAYPASFESMCLYEIDRMKKLYGEKIKIGFSGHHLGIAIDMIAFALGAEYIERHFTLDRTWPGTDHAASLEPGGLRKLVRDIEAGRQSLQYKDGVLPCEIDQRRKLKKMKLNPEFAKEAICGL